MSDESSKKRPVNRKGIKGLSFRDKRNLAILIGIGIAAIVLLVVVVVLLGEKAGSKEEPAATEIQKIEEDPEVVEEEAVDTPVPEGTQSPLTGTYIKESWAKKRPVALMIENTSMALPQYGLNSCGVIYE